MLPLGGGGTYHQIHYYYLAMAPSLTTVKEQELTLPKWNPSDSKWSEFYSKVATALHKYDIGYLLFEQEMVP